MAKHEKNITPVGINTSYNSVDHHIMRMPLPFFLYKNGVHYFDTLQTSITDQGIAPEAVYIDIPDNEWDDFAAQFATKVYNSKSDYRNRSLLITGVVALIGGAVTYFVSGRALKPLREFSETVEKVQAQNLTEYTIEGKINRRVGPTSYIL
mgnify:CR=1 FL=1